MLINEGRVCWFVFRSLRVPYSGPLPVSPVVGRHLLGWQVSWALFLYRSRGSSCHPNRDRLDRGLLPFLLVVGASSPPFLPLVVLGPIISEPKLPLPLLLLPLAEGLLSVGRKVLHHRR